MTPLEKLKAKLARAAEIKATAETEKREYTEAEVTELETLAADCDKLHSQIELDKKLSGMAAELDAPSGRQTAPEKPAGNQGAQAKGPESEDTRGFIDLADFAKTVHAAHTGNGIDPRLYAAGGDGGMSTNGNNGEGFMVPPTFSGKIFELALEDDSDLLGLVDQEPTLSNRVEMPTDESTPWAAGGIEARWRSEKSKMDSSNIDTGALGVDLHSLFAFTHLTEELLEDAPRLAARLSVKAPAAVRWKLNEAIRYGTGVGQPLGYMNSKALVTVAKESGQTMKLVAENVANMVSRLLPSSFNRAHWEINPELLSALMMLKIGDMPIWTPPSTGFNNAPGGFLLGRPIRFTEHARALGTVGDIQLIDPYGYYMPVKQGGLKFAQSMHLKFDTNEQALRWTFRAGGQTKLSKPVAPNHGSATKSHFVTLGAR